MLQRKEYPGPQAEAREEAESSEEGWVHPLAQEEIRQVFKKIW